MCTCKKFEKWISANFKGLSSTTLVQFLMEGIPEACIANADEQVYVNLWNVFTGRSTEDERILFDAIKFAVECDPML